jgi:hypothetical protein
MDSIFKKDKIRQDLQDFQDGFIFIAFQKKAMKPNPAYRRKGYLPT